MPKGPLGGPRPLSEYRIILDPHEPTIRLLKVGPLGFPRPFAKNNPPISDDRVSECMVSGSGRKFGAGVVSNGATKNITDLTPPQRKRALELAEKWCEGMLESTAMEGLEEGEATEVLDTIEEQLDQMLEEGQEFRVDMGDSDQEEAVENFFKQSEEDRDQQQLE